MNGIIDYLRERHKSFIDEKEVSNFFFGLADYVRYIEKTPSLYEVIKEELKEKEGLMEERKQYEEKALQELELAKKDILKIVDKNKKENKELDQIIYEFKLFQKGKIRSSGTKADNVERYLWNISRILYGLGYKKELKKFIENNPKTENVFFDRKNINLSDSLRERHKLEENLEKLRGKKIWSCWDYLRYVPVFWIDGEYWEAIPDDKYEVDNCFDLIELVRRSEKENSNRVVLYVDENEMVARYRLYTNRIHLFLLEKISFTKKDKKNLSTGKNIDKITIIELKTGKYLIAVNDDYENAKQIRKSKYYPILIEEIEKRDVLERTDYKKISKEMADYFNNNKKCLIYMNGKYGLTTIFTGSEEDREINWEVKTELIDEDKYKKLLKK